MNHREKFCFLYTRKLRWKEKPSVSHFYSSSLAAKRLLSPNWNWFPKMFPVLWKGSILVALKCKEGNQSQTHWVFCCGAGTSWGVPSINPTNIYVSLTKAGPPEKHSAWFISFNPLTICSPFIDEEIKARRSEITCPDSIASCVVPGFRPKFASRIHVFSPHQPLHCAASREIKGHLARWNPGCPLKVEFQKQTSF